MKDLIRRILREEIDNEFEDIMNFFEPSNKTLSEYTCDDLRELVQNEKIYSQEMFKQYYPKEHKHAVDNGCYPFIFDLQTNEFGGIDKRKIYTFKWESSEEDGRKKAYVGLAHNIYRRYKQHLKGTIGAAMKKHGRFSSFDVIDGFFSAHDAQCKEESTIQEMKDNGYDIINPDEKSRSLGACKRNIQPYEEKLERVFKDKNIDFLKTEDPLLYDLLKTGQFGKIGVTVTPRPRNYCFKDLKTNKEYGSVTCLARANNEKYTKLRSHFLKFDTYNDTIIKKPIADCGENIIYKCPIINERKLMIGKILKEETSRDDLDKGIDIAVKVLKKNYPFIVGWEYSNDPEQWAYKIYINLEIDHTKSMEFYKLKPHPRFGRFIKDSIINRETMVYPFSFTNYEDEDFDTRVYLDIHNDLSEIYEDMIPVKFKMERGKSVLNQDDPKELAVDNYIYVK